MRRRLLCRGGGFIIIIAQTSAHVVQTPQEVQWGPAPPLVPPGAQIAVLAGDPGRPAPYTVRLKFPANYSIQCAMSATHGIGALPEFKPDLVLIAKSPSRTDSAREALKRASVVNTCRHSLPLTDIWIACVRSFETTSYNSRLLHSLLMHDVVDDLHLLAL